jgi:hypothetical protein
MSRVLLPSPVLRPAAAPAALPLPAGGCDCASCPLWIHNPAATEPICSGSAGCDYCTCARAEDPTRGERSGACAGCLVRCGSRVDIAAWVADIGGTFTFDDLTAPGRLPPGLPAFIPQVDGGDLVALDTALAWHAYAIGLRRVFSPASRTIYPRFRDRPAHEALRLRPGRRAVLVGYAEDPLIEAYWTRRHTDRLAAALADQRWDLVLAPNASCYHNQPRAEQLLNFRPNLVMAAELAAAGLPTAPCLYWARLEDLERYRDWLTDLDGAHTPASRSTYRPSAPATTGNTPCCPAWCGSPPRYRQACPSC